MRLLNNNINSYNQNNSSLQKNVSFSGGKGNVVIDVTSKPIRKAFDVLVQTKKIDQFIKWSAKSKDNTNTLQKMFIAGTSCLLSGFYMINTARSKKIDKERKAPLLWNMGIVGVMTTIGALAIDGPVKKATEKYGNKLEGLNKNLSKQEIKDIKLGINLGTKIAVFALMYRYIAPVIATPLASKAVNFFHDKNKDKKTDTVA